MKFSPYIIVVITTLFSGLGQGQEPETVIITPEWINENPGRLTIGVGSAFNGSNDWWAELRIPNPAVWELTTELVGVPNQYEQTPPDLSMYRMTTRVESPNTSAKMVFHENKPYSIKPIFHMSALRNVSGPNDPPDWRAGTTYKIDMRDFETLLEAIARSRSR